MLKVSQIDRFKFFSENQGFSIIKEKKMPYGYQIQIEKGVDRVFISFFNNGNVLVQGKESLLKKIAEYWARKRLWTDSVSLGYGAFAMGWREWTGNAKWLSDFISVKGIPNEDEALDDFKIHREIMFHDFMFRHHSGAKIHKKYVENVINGWFQKYCFMRIDVDNLLKDIFTDTKEYILDDYESLPLSVVADSISCNLCNHCSEYMCKLGGGEYGCLFLRRDHNDCAYEIIDALFPYSSAKEVVAYTKSNFMNLINRKRYLKWHKLSPKSPTEESMEDAIQGAGLVYIPQYQAYDAIHKYRIDFVIKTLNGPNIAIECDGLEYHSRPSNYIRDRKRDRYLQEKGFYIMRFSSREIFNEIDKCIEEIDRNFWLIQKGKFSLKKKPRNSYFGIHE